MIHLYTWTTPNGRKPAILLEEIGMPYEVHPVNIGKDEQFAPAFLAISPNNKIPAIVDDAAPGGSLSLFESLGFRKEALLHDQVRDRAGASFDLAILSRDVAQAGHRQPHRAAE